MRSSACVLALVLSLPACSNAPSAPSAPSAAVPADAFDWLGPSVLATTTIDQDLQGKRFRTPAGVEWIVRGYVPPAPLAPSELACGTLTPGHGHVLGTRPPDDPETLLRVYVLRGRSGLHVACGPRHEVLEDCRDGDIADVYRRVTGRRHPFLAGRMSRGYREFLERLPAEAGNGPSIGR